MLDHTFHLLFPLGANFHTVRFLCRRWKPHRPLRQVEGSAVFEGRKHQIWDLAGEVYIKIEILKQS